MTYVEKSQMNVPSIALAEGSMCIAAGRIFSVIFDRPLRAWRNSRDLHEISQFSTAQLRDIGLAPSDVVAARLAPAGVMLAHLAERRRQSDDSTDSKAAQPVSSQREPA